MTAFGTGARGAIFRKAKQAAAESLGWSTSGGVLASAIDLSAWTAVKVVTDAQNVSGDIRLTSASHGFANEDEVLVCQVGGMLVANGAHPVVVVDANTIKLNGATPSGTYTSGGYIIPLDGVAKLSDITAAAILRSSALTSSLLAATLGVMSYNAANFVVTGTDDEPSCDAIVFSRDQSSPNDDIIGIVTESSVGGFPTPALTAGLQVSVPAVEDGVFQL